MQQQKCVVRKTRASHTQQKLSFIQVTGTVLLSTDMPVGTVTHFKNLISRWRSVLCASHIRASSALSCMRWSREGPSSGSSSAGPVNRYSRLLCPKRTMSPTLEMEGR